MRIKITALISLILFPGCGFVVKDRLIGNFYLVAVDTGEQTDLSFCPPGENGCFPVIRQTVFAAGYSDQYFIVKQHPNNDKSITNYYIVPINDAKKRAGTDSLFTPLTSEQFDKQKKVMGLEKVKFSIIYKELE